MGHVYTLKSYSNINSVFMGLNDKRIKVMQNY